MLFEFDEERWPRLGEFRKACLGNDFENMQEIADCAYEWYTVENPNNIQFERLADIFRAQHYASDGDLASLSAHIAAEPWVLDEPWTSQRWTPLSQAITADHVEVVSYLLSKGANPLAVIGDPTEEATVEGLANSDYCKSEVIRQIIRDAIHGE